MDDDVEDISGRNRDHLLTAWYENRFRLQQSALGISPGFIDSTDYLDENAYANDEYTQFMNEVFVNASQAFLPPYEAGDAAEWETGRWSVRGVAMNVGKNDDENEYNFLGVMVGCGASTSWGQGNYRLTLTTTSQDFPGPSCEEEESLLAVELSFDQQLGSHWGAFLRFGWQDDDAAVDHDAIYAGGLNIRGGPWGRVQDNIGVGFAYLDGGLEVA